MKTIAGDAASMGDDRRLPRLLLVRASRFFVLSAGITVTVTTLIQSSLVGGSARMVSTVPLVVMFAAQVTKKSWLAGGYAIGKRRAFGWPP